MIFVKICGVYRIYNKVTKYYYFGSSIDCKRRIEAHKSDLKKNKHVNPYLQKSWNVHEFINFEFTIIEEVERNKIVEREQWWIDNTKKVYNVAKKATPGPHYPKTTWDEERRKSIVKI